MKEFCVIYNALILPLGFKAWNIYATIYKNSVLISAITVKLQMKEVLKQFGYKKLNLW